MLIEHGGTTPPAPTKGYIMEIVQSSFEIITPKTLEEGQQMLRLIEQAGRTCYKSEDKITENSAEKFVTMLRDKGHHAMLEFGNMTVRFVIPRHLSHELVRHRLCSFAQTSTRYVSYKNGIQVIKPSGIELETEAFGIWYNAMTVADALYKDLIKTNCSAQIARSVLPLSLKTEVVCSANLREWVHIFQLRTSSAAHPDMRDIMVKLLEETKKIIPVIFDDIGE